MEAAVRMQIVRFVDPHQPGFVECELIDAHGVRWSFIEKVPVVTHERVDERSSYPRAVFIACRVLERFETSAGLEVARISTEWPWGIAATGGQTIFEVPRGLLREATPNTT